MKLTMTFLLKFLLGHFMNFLNNSKIISFACKYLCFKRCLMFNFLFVLRKKLFVFNSLADKYKPVKSR